MHSKAFSWVVNSPLNTDLNNYSPLYTLFVNHAIKPNKIEAYHLETEDKIIVILKADNDFFRIDEGISFHLFSKIDDPSKDYLSQFKKLN